MEAKKLKRVVIKEEIYAVTGDTISAIILGQFLYWQDRVRDFDKFIEEEKSRKAANGEMLDVQLTNGWMYKTAKELIDECMLNISEVTARRYIQKLIDSNFIDCRKNPNNKWDRTLQYRVNLDFLINSIKDKGYDGLSDYKLQKEYMKLQNEDSYQKNEEAIPKTTYRDYNQIEKENEDKSSFEKKEVFHSIAAESSLPYGKPKKKNNELDLSIVESEEMLEVVKDWLEYKKERGESYKPRGFSAFYKKLKEYSGGDVSKAKEIVETSMANNWQGIFALKQSNQSNKKDEKEETEYIRGKFKIGNVVYQ